MHPTEDRLLAYMDDELAREERRNVARHLEACRRCTGTLEELHRASGRIAAALERLDRPAPAVDPKAIRRRAGLSGLARSGEDDASAPTGVGGGVDPSSGPGAVDRPRRSLLAAAVLLVVFTGAAAAIPGSPVRAWLTDSARAIAGLFESDESPSPAPAQEAMEVATRLPSGVAVEPYGGRVRISLRSPSPDAVVRVRLVEGSRASVLAADARYRTGAGRIEVLDAGAGEVRIEIPRSVRSAVVELDGSPVVEKEGPDLRLLTPADTSGSEIFFRPAG